ncbi:MAG: PP2C family protein-serine/threonine phosphatase [Terracidiphilus sp.]
MKKLPLPLVLFLLCACIPLRAQEPDTLLQAAPSPALDTAHPSDWIMDINQGWLEHDGDNPAWAQPAFDDSAWEPVELADLGPADPGWQWYRLHLKLPPNRPQLALLIEGGVGAYALYINGTQIPGPRLLSAFGVNRPVEFTVPINIPGNELQISLRTHTPISYAAWHFPLFMTASLGTTAAIENQRQSMESDRLYSLIPALAFNLLFLLAGIGAWSLHRSQPNHSEYQWLGIYLFLLGTADVLWYSQQAGLLPLSANLLIADPLLFIITVAQIQFTFSFGGQRLGRIWRAYRAILLIAPVLTWFTWSGKLPTSAYMVVEPLLIVPVAVFLPILLFIWYRRGNREAGWLILPSLLPAATTSLYDLGSASIYFGWQRFDFLDNPIQFGPVSIQPNDIGNFLFLLAIAVVMFFRFTRVSRDQARSAAELDAAREIQQRLVPSSLPDLPGYKLAAAYLPAQEVGGDFYQVLAQPDGSALVVVGDVSGKGLKAAMTGALAIGALRALADDNLRPAALLARLNQQLLQTQDSGFVTCICIRIEPSGAVTIANAGHLSPYRHGEEVTADAGLPLGIAAGIEYSETQFVLAPGDTLTLLTDGVVEARNKSGQLYGFDRTAALSTQSAEKVSLAAQAFGQEDDITVLTVARTAAVST